MDVTSAESVVARMLLCELGDDSPTIHNLVYSSARSQIFYATSSAHKKPLAIKLWSNSLGHEQFEALRSTSRTMGRSGEFSVPEPIYVSKDGSIVVTEWVDAEPLGTVLRRRGLSLPRILSYSNRAGRWLRHFHRTVRLPPTILNTERLLEVLENELDQCGSSRKSLPRVIETAHCTLVSSTKHVAQELVSQGRIHGDFKPDNILISDARAVGIDFTQGFHNAVPSDLANFVNHLVLHTYEPSAFRWFGSRDSLARAFLEGYKDADTILSPTTLNWMRLYNFLLMWFSQFSQGKRSLSELYLKNALMHEMRKCLRQYPLD